MKTKRPKKIGQSLARIELLAFVTFALITTAWFIKKNQAVVSPIEATVAVASEDDVILVPTPLRAVAKGERIDQVPFSRTKWPKSQLKIEYLKNVEGYGSFVTLASLPANLPVPILAIGQSGAEGNAVIDRIPQEMRAITIRVDEESAVEGWARPGDFVDIILLRQSKEVDIGIEAKVIAENVKILSAGRSAESTSSNSATAPRTPATVTVLVDQENALKVKAAANIGKLTFALRAGGDDAPTLARRIDQKTLLGNSRALLPQQPIYQGKATGPDGKVYVLSDQSQWIKSE